MYGCTSYGLFSLTQLIVSEPGLEKGGHQGQAGICSVLVTDVWDDQPEKNLTNVVGVVIVDEQTALRSRGECWSNPHGMLFVDVLFVDYLAS